MKSVVIMSGVPGCGKSHTISKLYAEHSVCSVDHYFIRNGNYKFDPTKLSKAHNACMQRFLFCIQSHVVPVVVDNTNISLIEIAPYVAVAHAYGAIVKIHTILVPCDLAYERNIHKVPLETIQRMDQELRQRILPKYWKCEKIIEEIIS